MSEPAEDIENELRALRSDLAEVKALLRAMLRRGSKRDAPPPPPPADLDDDVRDDVRRRMLDAGKRKRRSG